MKKLITSIFLLACLLIGAWLYAGEDAGLAGAAFVKAKNISSTGNQTLFQIGTTASPSISFLGDDNTGIYGGTDNLFVSLGGSTKWSMYTTYITNAITLMGLSAGQPRIDFGTAPSSSSPVYTFVSNTNTGLGRNAVGQPSMVASGTEIQRWTDRQIYEPLINAGGIFVSHTSIKGYKLTTDATAARLTVDGSADSASNRWSIASGTTITGQVYVSGIATDSTRASVGYVIGFKAQRVNSTVTVATCSTEIMEDASLTGCSADVLADSTNGAFYVSVIGSTTTNLRWGCVAKYMEVNQP